MVEVKMNKPLSMFQQLLKIVLMPLIVVALSLMILLPICAVFIVRGSSMQSEAVLYASFQQTFNDLEVKMNSLAQDEIIKNYLIKGIEEISVYEKLYEASYTSEYKLYFYLTDSKFEREVIYQPTHATKANSFLTLANTHGIEANPDTMVLLINSRSNQHLAVSLVFAQGIFHEGECIGYLIISFYPSQIESLIGKTDHTVLLTNHQAKIVYTNNSRFADIPYLNTQQQLGPFIWVNGGLYLYQKDTIEATNLNLVTLYNLNIIPQIIIAVLVTLLLSIAIAIFVFIVFRNRISKDMFVMLDDMFASLEGYYQKGEFIPVQVRDNSLTDIILQYNSILQELQDLVIKNQQLVQDTTSAQIRQLQSQFNPHFIFNTLASIQVMAHKDTNAATAMIQKLAGMLRYSIRFGKEDRILLSDDIEYIKDYLSLQKIRFQDLLEYQIKIEESNFLVPKLILQPIIENSIQHGFRGDIPFLIEITVYHIREDLVMIVRDNGIGMNRSKLKKIQRLLKEQPEESTYVGLVNCHRRLQLFYGDNYGITVDSREGKGTVIVLTCKAERK